MGRNPNPLPTYLRHRQSGKARIVVYDHSGERTQILLPGEYGSKESRAEYDRICGILKANNGRLPTTKNGTVDLTISEFVLRYMEEHASGYYVDPLTKEPTSEIDCLTLAFRPLNRLYGNLPVCEFDSLMLEALQTAMATGSWLNPKERKKKEKENRQLGVARSTVNHHTDRIKRLFRWGCAKKIVQPDQLTNLEAVASLKQSRSIASDTVPVTPVDEDTIDKTLPFLPPVPADMVRLLLLLTGARIGELCRLTGADLDQSGPIWLYRLNRHKTRHRGHTRTVAFGPKAQLILRRYLKDDPDAFLFSPAEQDALIKAKKRANRKSKVQPSQVDRRKTKPKHQPGECYDPRAINHAIRRACLKAGVAIWHTHQLRHSAALLIMREHGVEAARSVLGHKTLNMTLHYSGIDLERAKEVASKIG